MSKTIDQRVVEMRFDNQHFEKNVKTSLSTLDKLKQSLKLTDASKGLENVSAAAKKVDMNGLSNGIQTVHTRFSALQIAGVTAMTRITNAAITAGKNIVKSLTITPITTGFSEYELKMGSIQTIMASTGESLETVNKYLNELNEYSDKTIYSFSDMTQNIGKFTNAGVKLKDAVAAIQGISNEAALSGANANEASRAMYNFAQALSAGYVKLIDWKSIENANMATVGFKEELINTAVEMGTLIKTTDGFKTAEGKVITATKNFNDSLQDQWMTSDVLITTLKKYSDETTEIGKKATQAATEVKTFSQMMDTLKESAQSGWAQTWEIIFGDFEEGKTLWTEINNVVGGFIDKLSKARNNFLKFTFGSSWDNIADQVQGAGIKMEDFQEALKTTAKKYGKDLDKMIEDEKSLTKVMEEGLITKEEVIETLETYSASVKENGKSQEDLTEKLKYFQKVVDQVWHGDYKNGKERIEALTKAGYKYSEVQELVNKTVDGHRLTLEDLSIEQMKSVGYTDEQIKAISELAEQARKADQPLGQLLERLNKPSGRELLIDSFKNIGKVIGDVFGAVGNAWDKVFNNEGDPSRDFSLYTVIEQFKKLTEEIQLSEGAVGKFENIMNGIFSAFDLSWSIASASTLGFLKIINEVLNLLGVKPKEGSFAIVDVLEYIALKISDFNTWVEGKTMFGSSTKWKDIADVVVAFVLGIKSCIDAFLELDKVKAIIDKFKKAFTDAFNVENFKDFFDFFNHGDVIENIKNLFENITNWIKGIGTTKDIGKYIVDGLVNGLMEGAYKVAKAVIDLATNIITVFCEILGINSPSKVFFQIGKWILLGLLGGLLAFGPEEFAKLGQNIIKGLYNGLISMGSKLWTLLSSMVDKFIDIVKQIDLGTLLATAMGVGMLWVVNKALNIINKVLHPVEAAVDAFKAIKEAFKTLNDGFNKYFKAKVWEIRSNTIMNIAKAIGILTLSIALLTYIAHKDSGSMWQAVGVVAALAGIMLALSFACEKLNKVGEFGLQSLSLVAIAGSILILATAFKTLSSIDIGDMGSVLVGVTAMIAGLAGLLFVLGKFKDIPTVEKSIDSAGWLMIKLSAALLIASYTLKQVASIPFKDAGKGLLLIGAVELLFLGMVAISKLAGEWGSKAGSMLIKMSAAMMLMVFVITQAAKLDETTVNNGLKVITQVGLLFTAVIAVSKLAGQYSTKAGTMLLGMSVAMGIMMFVIKQAAGITKEEIKNSLMAITHVMILFGAIIAVSQFAGEHAAKAGTMLLLMSGAMLIMVGAIAILGLIPTADLTKGVAAVSVLMGFFAVLIASTRGVQDCMKNLIVIVIAVALLSAAVAMLANIPAAQLVPTTAALVSLMGAFALIMATTKTMGNAKSMIAPLAVLTIVTGALAWIVSMLSNIQNGDAAIKSATALSILLTTLAGAMAILGTLKTGVSWKTVGVMAVLGAVFLELAVILHLMNLMKIENAIPNAEALSLLLLAMSACLVPLGLIGKLGAHALGTGLAALGVFVTGLTIIATILGAIEQWSKGGFSKILDDGVVIFEKLGECIGAFIGGIAGGVMSGYTSGLEDMGTNLSNFMTNAKGFFDGVEKLDSKTVDGVKTLAEALLILLGVEFVNFLTSPLLGDSSLEKFGKNLVPFGKSIALFSETIDGKINASAVTSAANCGKLLAEMADTVPNSGGLISWFTGGNSIHKFGRYLISFGYSLVDFSNILTSNGGIDEAAITSAKNAGQMMVDLANTIPNTGGLISFFTGDNNLTTFGEQLNNYGYALTNFSKTVSGENTVDAAAIEAAAKAGEAMLPLATSVPRLGGLIDFFAGTTSLSMFGSQLTSYGRAILAFSNIVTGEKTIDIAAIETAAKAGEAMIPLATSVPRMGGLIEMFTGVSSLSVFGSNLKSYGKSLAKFSKAITEEGGINIDAINSAAAASSALVNLQNGLGKSGGLISFFTGNNDFATFGVNLSSFGRSLKNYSKHVSEVDTTALSNSTSEVSKLAHIAKILQDVDSDGLKDFGKALGKVGEDGVDKFVKAFEDAHKDVIKATGDLIGEVPDAANDKQKSIKEAFQKLAGKAASGIKASVKDFRTAGKELAAGLINGINLKQLEVYNVGYALGQKAVQGERDGQKSQSPSKETFQSGIWIGEGLINGIVAMGKKVYNAGHSLGENATNSITSAVSRISDAINSDIDTQPTIRPVLDLSDVQAGANSIGSMFGLNPSVGVLATANGINASMNANRQNGTNNDIISAINKLDKHLGNVGGTVNNINGITYSGNSEINDAIKVLVRAAKMEGRV